LRLRPCGLKLFSPHQIIQTAHLYHHQVYDFSVHKAKLALLLQEYKNGKFDNLREFLEAIQSECPHQFFQDGLRASELKVDFSLEEVYQGTSSYATEVITKIVPLLGEANSPVKDKLIDCCLKIPELIAASHSHRFETGDELKTLDEALELCNKAVVYLEQARDIYVLAIEGRAACEDLIKRYILIRRRVFNLYKAWKKFRPETQSGLTQR